MASTKVTFILFLGVFACVPMVTALVEDVVLDVYLYVQVNELATYSCRASGAKYRDPVFAWSIRNVSNSRDIIADSNTIREVSYDNRGNSTDGTAESTTTFMVLSNYIGHYLWCYAREFNESGDAAYKGIPARISIGSPPPRGGLGQLCNIDGSCNSNTLTCEVNTATNRQECVCVAGYIQSGTTCISKVELGQICDSNNNCRPTNSFCDAQQSPNVCACNSGYLAYGGECYLINVPLDNSCLVPGQICTTTYSVCSTTSRTCVCNTNAYRIILNTVPSCLLKGSVGGTGCTVGYDSCSNSNSVCVDGQCQCSTSYVWNGSQCVTSTYVGLGDSCDDQTLICSSPLVCRTTFPRVCECGSNYYEISNSCQPKASLGGTCTVNYDSCLTVDATCTTGVCECRTGYVRSGSTCIPRNTAGLNEPCDGTTVICSVSDSECRTTLPRICVCKATYYASGGACLPGGGIGALCSATEPSSCLTVNAECRSDGTNYRCACVQGYEYIPATGTCDLPSLGAECVTSIGCKQTASGGTTTNPVCYVEGATVVGVCSCPANYYGYNGQCLRAGGIGSECYPLDPASCLTANSECSSATSPARCACISGYVYSATSLTCNKPTLGQSCTVSVGCQATATDATTTNPQCISGVCSCPTNYYRLNGQCVQKKGLNEVCNSAVSDSCSDSHATCTSSGVSFTCQCASPYVNINGVCAIDNSGEFCPAVIEDTTPKPGVSSPTSLTTPSVRVGSTCYEVALYRSETMVCEDTNKMSALQHGRWEKLVDGTWTNVGQTTGTFINGDAAIPSLTVSNAQPSYAGNYRCVLCYGTGETRCTTSETVKLYVTGTAITSATATMSPSAPTKGDSVSLTCTTNPAGVATSFLWYKNGVRTGISTDVLTINNVQPNSDGSYYCEARNDYGTKSSADSPVVLSVRYAPVLSGDDTQDVYGNLATQSITITCAVDANPNVQTYYFYDNDNNLLQGDSRRTFVVDNDQGYGTYWCEAENAVGKSPKIYFNVQLSNTPGTGAATEDLGLSTGTIVAIVLGIIFLLLLILIIIVCCCSYGWCRKKEKIEPQVVAQPVAAKPYVISRPMFSAGSAVSRKDVGVLVKGNDFPPEYDDEPHYIIPTMLRAPPKHHMEPEERYTPSPRYYLKPANKGGDGPIISMYDDKYSEPRPLQLPALDTQYLYVDNDEPKKRRRRRKKHRHEHRDRSPRQSYYEQDPDREDVETKYAEVLDARSDDLVVVPGKQNYFE